MAKVDLFAKRRLMQAVKNRIPVHTFLSDTFFGTVQTFDTENIDFDLVEGNRTLAPFVSTRIGSETMDGQGFVTKTFKAPLVAPDSIFTGEDLQNRLPGENIYDPVGPDSRLAQLIADRITLMDDSISRREEWMCAQALQTGAIPIVGKGVNATISYGVTNITTAASGDKFTATSSDPITYLKNKKRAMVKACGINPTFCLMASDVADAYMTNATVLKYLNTYRNNINIGTINPQPVTIDGTYYIGTIQELGLDLYSYEEYYTDPTDGTVKPMMNPGTLFLGSPRAGFKMGYGAITDVSQMGAETMIGNRVPKSWVENKPARRFLSISSRPLPIITYPNALCVVNGLV